MNSNEQLPELKCNGRMYWTALFFVMKSKTIWSCSAFMLKGLSAVAVGRKEGKSPAEAEVHKEATDQGRGQGTRNKGSGDAGLQLNLRN